MLRKPGGDRELVDILALVLQHDKQAVLVAVELALSEGVPTKTHVLNPARTGWSTARWWGDRHWIRHRRWPCTANPRPMSSAMTGCAARSPEVAMRHDPASGAIVIMLRSWKMHGMAQAVTYLIEQGAPAFEAAIPILAQLLKAELAEREVGSIAYHMKAARFPLREGETARLTEKAPAQVLTAQNGSPTSVAGSIFGFFPDAPTRDLLRYLLHWAQDMAGAGPPPPLHALTVALPCWSRVASFEAGRGHVHHQRH
jgi:hypothetical protein